MRELKVYDVRVLPGDSAFLLDDGETSILVDSGFGFTGFGVAENIRKVLGERKLDFIFLTHSHYDHAAGSPYVKRRYPNAKVVAGAYAATIFAKPTARAVMRDLDRKVADSLGIGEYEDLLDELCADITVENGDLIQAGDMVFTAINFVGHTRCSAGYYLAENKLLLGTETLGVHSGADFVVPSYLVGFNLAMESIKKAQAMDIQQILVPHYGLLEKEKTGLAIMDTLTIHSIHFCFLDDFCTSASYKIKTETLIDAIQTRIDAILHGEEQAVLNVKEIMDSYLKESWIEMTTREKDAFYERYLRKMKLIVEVDGNVSIQIPTT